MAVVTGNLFVEIGFVIIIAALAAYIFRVLRQPQILAYVAVGVLITPVFGFVTDTSIVESMSIVGIAFLLFIVGLEMDLKSLRAVSLVSTLGGLIQVVLMFIFGYLIALALGFLSLESAYVGLMLAFSSTMVVMKLLSDKRELQTLHGRIVVGILLVQDIIAILALSILASINDFSFSVLGTAFAKFVGLFALAYVTSKYVFPRIFNFAAKNQELLLITSLAVCFTFSLAFHFLGFSVAIGAFVAGLTLGNLDYNIEIIGKVKSLKDFFSLLFFVSLGMGISVAVIKSMWLEIIVLMITIMLLKPLVIMAVCMLFKYTKRPSFMTANALAQIGEFSLILASAGLLLGHISQDLFSLTVIITLASITLTSYYIEHSGWFFKLLEKPLSFFNFFSTEKLEYLPSEAKPQYILCGHNRIGYSILKSLHKVKKNVLVVDYNPEIIARMVKEEYHCIYGEVSDDEIIDRMNLSHIKLLISTVPNTKDNLFLIHKVRSVNKRAKVFVTASDVDESLKLYEAGANYVILPHFLGGEHAAHMIDKHRQNKIDLKIERKRHIAHLKERKKIGHGGPHHRM
jgi:Kef-type K+ transport system membrane component KefB